MTSRTPRDGSVWRAVLGVGAALALAGGCFQKVNDGASRGIGGATSGGSEVITRIVPSTDPIALDPMDEASTTMDPCEKTRRDKTEILTAFCASCHAGSAAVGLPPWNFVLDDDRLVKELWTREGQPPQRFVIPGDPAHSALYQRMAIVGDMPPQPTDLGTHRNPTPSLADISIIEDWILHCLGASPPTATGGSSGSGGGSGSATGGTTGAGAATGGTGSGGATGRAGAPGSTNGTGGAPSGSGGSAGVMGTGGASGAGAIGAGTGGRAAGSGGRTAGTGGRAAGSGGTSMTDGGATDVPSASGGTSGGATDAGVTSDAGTIETCATGVSNGDSCAAHTPSCQAGSRTCRCELSNGRHSWSCR
jgi:hypothetical protein